MPAPPAAATSTVTSSPDPGPAPSPAPGRRRPPESSRRNGTAARAGGVGTTAGAGSAGSATAESAGDVVRWAVFCCALVPVVLVVYGTSLGGAAGTALGLATVTAVCRVLLRRAERGLRAEAARPQSRRSPGGRNPRRG